jgi:hypothetical protein
LGLRNPGGESSVEVSPTDRPLNRAFSISYGEDSGALDEDWYVRFTSGADSAEVLGVGEASLLSARLTRVSKAGTYQMNGHWARVTDAGFTAIRSGILTGTVQVDASAGIMAGAVRFVSEQDGGEFTAVMTGRSSHTESSFLSQIEDSEYVMPLMYRELLPRKLAWVTDIEHQLPAQSRGRYLVQRLADASLNKDGILNDDAWMKCVAIAPNGKLLPDGQDRESEPALRLFRCNDGLNVSVSVPRVGTNRSRLDKVKGIRVEILLAATYSIPYSATPILKISIDAAVKKVTTRVTYGGISVESDGGDFAVARRGDTWSLEGEISELMLKDVTGWSGGAAIWRCGVDVTIRDAGGKWDEVARWGAHDASDLRHGLILEL